MAFIRKTPFNFKSFIQTRAMSYNFLGKSQQFFRDNLPNFPYPNPSASTRHQAVQPRPPPVKPDTLTNTVPAKLNKPDTQTVVPLLSRTTKYKAVPIPIPAKVNKTTIGKTDSPHLRPPDVQSKRSTPSMPIETAVRTMMKQVQYQKHTQERQEEMRREQVQRDSPDRNIEKLFKMQHTNLHNVKEHDRLTKQHNDKLRLRQRLNELMELMREQDECKSVNKAIGDNQNSSLVDRPRMNHILPPFQTHFSSTRRYKQNLSEFGPYTPTNSDSDNGDVLAKSSRLRLKSSPASSSSQSQRLDNVMARPPQPFNKESALSILCKNAMRDAN